MCSARTIYQSLLVQGRGHLRADLHKQLRTGRAVRRPRRSLGQGQASKIPNPISISERPAEAADRAVPGHWEGDLILGAHCRSAIATLVERSTRYVMLLHLPDGHDAVTVRDRLIPLIQTLPHHSSPVLDLGPGHRARPPPRHHPGHRHGRLLLRPSLTLAARIEREHQRPTPPIFPEGQQPVPPQPTRPGGRRRRAEWQTPQDPRLGQARRSHATAIVKPVPCCEDRLNPPSSSGTRCAAEFVHRHIEEVQFDTDTKATSYGSHLVAFDPRREPEVEDNA